VSGGSPDEVNVSFMISMVKSVRPRDSIEAMLVAQMVSVHVMAMRCAHQLASADIARHDSAARALGRLASTFPAQIEALNRYRSHGEPAITVQNVSVGTRQSADPGGMQIWASNPALVWTSARPEEAGLHIHLYDSQGNIAVDDTFDCVTVDGIELNESHVQYHMAQQALPHLSDKVVSLTCPRCDNPHFDMGESAFFPHSEHSCENCQEKFVSKGRRKLVISNPFGTVRMRLLANRQSNPERGDSR